MEAYEICQPKCIPRHFENMIIFHYVANIVSADGLVPSGAMPSAGAVMAKFKPCVHIHAAANRKHTVITLHGRDTIQYF